MRKFFVILGLFLSLVVGAFGVVLTPLSSLDDLKTYIDKARSLGQSDGTAKTDKLVSNPFVTAFATGEPKRVKAYEELTPGFWVGFDETKTASVYVRQRADSTQIGGPESKYLIDVDIKDAAGSQWVTVEKAIDKPGVARLVVALTARMAEPAKVDFVLFIPQKGRPPERITIGTADIGTDFKSFILEKAVDLQNFPNIETDYPSRIVALLPARAGIALELARFDIFSS